jgi:hypothetical protein
MDLEHESDLMGGQTLCLHRIAMTGGLTIFPAFGVSWPTPHPFSQYTGTQTQ